MPRSKEESMTSKLLLVAILAICFAGPANATRLDPQPGEKYAIYAGDALLTRPFLLGVTVIGAVVYGVTLPFTYFSHDPSVVEVLVKQPAAATFTRCLGCQAGETVR
jgi:hypothetical protein